MLRADLHIHSEYSFDCKMSLETIIERCLKLGINCVAIADHGTAAGGLKLKEIAPFKVIVAEEVLTTVGEIMGLFLTEDIPCGLSPEETVKRIKAQRGLVCLPHPLDRFRGIARNRQEIEKVIADVDIIETFNSRVFFKKYNRKADLFAREHGLVRSAGSDAHIPRELGHAYVEMPDFNGSEDFCAALKQGTIVGRRSCPLVHLPTTWIEIKKKLLGKNH